MSGIGFFLTVVIQHLHVSNPTPTNPENRKQKTMTMTNTSPERGARRIPIEEKRGTTNMASIIPEDGE